MKNTITLLTRLGFLSLVCLGFTIACTDNHSQHSTAGPSDSKQADQNTPTKKVAAECADKQPLKKALFGDLHVHTTLSFDANAYGIRTTPADAYRFAKGEEIAFLPYDEKGNMTGSITIDRPLDFMAVTDHAEFLGEYQLCTNDSYLVYNSAYCQTFRAGGFEAIRATATALALDTPKRISPACPGGDACVVASAIPWKQIIDAAELANDTSADCNFTAFVGYEYSGSPSSSNYHRNVIFRSASVPDIPISRFEAPLDFYLWQQLNQSCSAENGCDYLTIPHNTNLSNGKLLTPYADLEDTLENKLEYARLRLAREPILELFQHKGASECANGFPGIIGAPDELCEMEQIRRIGKPGKTGRVFFEQGMLKYSLPKDNPTRYCEPGELGFGAMQGNGCLSENDFYRTALLSGLKEEKEIGLNPVKFCASASTDTHMSTGGAVSEREWRGHIYQEWTRDGRLLTPGFIPSGVDGNPGGLTGVWAEENSRGSIFEAMLRKEVFGTSGPRIKPRFFASWNFSADLCESPEILVTAYRDGVPMGADLSATASEDAAPVFLAMAVADLDSEATPLQKLQIVKGWVDSDGGKHYKVFHVAGDADSSAGVNMETGERYGDGHKMLCGVFEDPEYNPLDSAYYYLRAVENPSPRWSMIDCLAYSEAERPDVCDKETIYTTVLEQAWTSPIWLAPVN